MLPSLFKVGPIVVHSLGIFVGFGVVVASFIIWKQARKKGLAEEKIIDIFILSLVGVIIFGRLWHVVTNWEFYIKDLGRIFLLSKYSGFSYLGGITGGLIVAVLTSFLFKLTIWEILDVFAYGFAGAVILGLGGCAATSCLPTSGGIEILILAIFIIISALIYAIVLILPRSPKFSIWQKRPGFAFLWYLIFGLLSLLILSYQSHQRIFIYFLGLGIALIVFLVRYREILSWSNFRLPSFHKLKSIWKTEEKA